MNTPSHLLMTLVAGKLCREKPPRFALAAGSIAPDLGLYLLTFGGAFWFTKIEGMSLEDSFRHIFDTLYFNDPAWIAIHNFLHAPFTIGALFLCALLWYRKTENRTGRWLLWFLTACAFHSVIDIVTHFDDGPLLFFPFNWSYRFSSPVSYWDPAHFGKYFMPFEAVLDTVLIGILIRWRWARPTPVNKPDK